MVDDRTLPQVQPIHIPPGMDLFFPPQTFGFFVLPKARARACMNSANGPFFEKNIHREGGIYLWNIAT